MKCFFHNSDLDGQSSGAILRYCYPDIELYGINYGDPFPWEKIGNGERVFMVDYGLQPFGEMEHLNDQCHLTWIDHHKTAIHDWADAGGPIADAWLSVDFAACELTWDYCMGRPGTSPVPQAITWLGRYDIWQHHDVPNCLEFQYGMRLYDTAPENQALWKRLFEDDVYAYEIAKQGSLLLQYEHEQNRKFAQAFAFEVEFDGLRCIAANKGMGNSLVFDSVYDSNRHDAMLLFAFRNGEWKVSLYTTKPEVDVSAVCKARGGGGHRGAAGFQSQTLPFLPPAS